MKRADEELTSQPSGDRSRLKPSSEEVAASDFLLSEAYADYLDGIEALYKTGLSKIKEASKTKDPFRFLEAMGTANEVVRVLLSKARFLAEYRPKSRKKTPKALERWEVLQKRSRGPFDLALSIAAQAFSVKGTDEEGTLRRIRQEASRPTVPRVYKLFKDILDHRPEEGHAEAVALFFTYAHWHGDQLSERDLADFFSRLLRGDNSAVEPLTNLLQCKDEKALQAATEAALARNVEDARKNKKSRPLAIALTAALLDRTPGYVENLLKPGRQKADK